LAGSMWKVCAVTDEHQHSKSNGTSFMVLSMPEIAARFHILSPPRSRLVDRT
jgi:hypothetical protein